MQLNKGSALLVAFQIIFMVLGGVAVLLRIIANRRRGRSPQIHDICCFICYIFMDAYALVFTVAAFHGMGQHITTLSPEQLVFILKSFLASEYMYNTSVIFMRLSILFLYLTLFPQKQFRYFAYAFGTFIFLFPFCSMLYLFGFCRPLSKYWDLQEPGECGSTFAVEMVSGAVNLILDCILILMPMPIVWRLQMPFQKKVAVTSIFGLGIANVGINVGRIAQPLTTNFDDFTYSTPGAAILVTAELMTGLLVSCIPTLAPLLKRNQTDGQKRACFPTHFFTSATPSSVFYKLFLGARSRSTDDYAESVPDSHTKEGSAAHTEMSDDNSRDPSVYQGHDRQAAYSKAKSMPRIDSSPVEIEDGIEMRVDVDTYQSESRRQSHQPSLQTSS